MGWKLYVLRFAVLESEKREPVLKKGMGFFPGVALDI
jgi:hypothetical protein